jgi:hypothetical protein
LVAAATPETILKAYYGALAHGDMAALREMMAPSSYLMTIEAYGLKRSFSDPDFKGVLLRIDADPSALETAEKAIAEILKQDAAKGEVLIADMQTESLGSDRCAVRYTEAGVAKKLSFSKTQAGWKIDYLAGRKCD